MAMPQILSNWEMVVHGIPKGMPVVGSTFIPAIGMAGYIVLMPKGISTYIQEIYTD